MSNKVMVDQIAFDEAEIKVCESIRDYGTQRGWSNYTIAEHLKLTMDVAACLRMTLFNTDKNVFSTTDKEDKINEQ